MLLGGVVLHVRVAQEVRVQSLDVRKELVASLEQGGAVPDRIRS